MAIPASRSNTRRAVGLGLTFALSGLTHVGCQRATSVKEEPVAPEPVTAEPVAPEPIASAIAGPLNRDAILAAQRLDEPQWYKDNIPFLDTPDDKLDEVYYYRWSTYKRALRYTVPGTGYVSTEYDVPIGYAGNPYTALPDAAGYHIQDGRWLANPDYAGDYLDFWLRGAGYSGTVNYSEWIIDAAYQRALVTGDLRDLISRLPELIGLYQRWSGRLVDNFPLNGGASNAKLYWQSPLSDATEYTETSMKSSNWFGGGAGYRPTINAYMYAAATAISKLARAAGDTATANDYASRAASIKDGVQKALWDPQRSFFFQVYTTYDDSNGALKGTRTTWRELMGYAPWAYNLPDAQYSSAWQFLTQPDGFGAAYGPTTLERMHPLEAEQAVIANATRWTSDSASNGSYIGQIDLATSSVTFTVDAPGAGTYPVKVFYANATGASSTHQLFVNGASTPQTVTYPATSAWGQFSAQQFVTVQVAMRAGSNTLKFQKGTGYAELDKISANPYFNYQAIPSQPNREDWNCCHWNGPSWPFQTSQVLAGLANLLQNYPAQSYITAADYREMLSDFTALQYKDGKPYVAEAANGDTGQWIYDGFNFSEHYNHSSYIDLVLTGLLGIKPQANDTLVLKPLVSPSWDYFAVQDLPYHGHKLTLVFDRYGTRYGQGSGLRVIQDGQLIHSAATLGETTIKVAPTVLPAASQRMMNVAANPLTMEQDWLNRAITQPYPRAFASYTNPVSNGPRCHSGQTCRPTTYDQPMRATDGWIRYDTIPDNRWTNLGSPNATDHLGVDFGAVRPLQQVSLYLYDDRDRIRAPAAYDVQYLDGQTWRSIPNQVKTPATPVGNDLNTVTFPALSTSQLRVVFTPQGGKFVGVTELQSWYPQPPPVRLVSKNSGLELAVTGDSMAFGAEVSQQAATGARSHQWNVVPAENGFSKLINVQSGQVLGIRDASTAAGALALQWGDNLTRDHLWSIVDMGNGYSKLVNAHSGMVLGIRDASRSVGAPALQWHDTGTDDHRWRIEAAAPSSAAP